MENPYRHYYANEHPFEKSGLGKAPFTARSFEYVAGTGNSCAHCGRHITNLNYVVSSDGRTFAVGSSCIERTGDEKLTDEIRAEKRKYEQDRYNSRKYWEKNELKHNNGRSLDDVAGDFYDEIESEYAKSTDSLKGVPKPYAEVLKDGKGGFRDSVAQDLAKGNLPRGRGLYITIEILAKVISGSRKNTKAYTAEYDKLETLFEATAEKEKAASDLYYAKTKIVKNAFFYAKGNEDNPTFNTEKVKKELRGLTL